MFFFQSRNMKKVKLNLNDLLIPIYEKISVKHLKLKAIKYEKLGNKLKVVYELPEKIKSVGREKVNNILENYFKGRKEIEVTMEEENEPYRVSLKPKKIHRITENKIEIFYQETERDPVISF